MKKWAKDLNRHFSQKIYTWAINTCKAISYHEPSGKCSQNHDETPLNTHWRGCNQKASPVRLQNGAATLANSPAAPRKGRAAHCVTQQPPPGPCPRGVGTCVLRKIVPGRPWCLAAPKWRQRAVCQTIPCISAADRNGVPMPATSRWVLTRC